ncbi:hypothetical protein IAR55_006254 [Kwoniella newhampshirensis]|uniref:Medium-chain specific acyl-CoA dehydrogenase, mitochondrial n=1 Tax=Kwoniella newhampshirensis TaxID=1651941 RepID=A0AAW0YG18_9TREE
MTLARIPIRQISRKWPSFTRRGLASPAASVSGPVSFALDDDQRGIQVLKEAHSLGLLNTHIPEVKHWHMVALEYKRLWKVCLIHSLPANSSAANGLAEAPLIVAGSHEIKAKYLGRMTEEPLMAAYCVTEPEAGSDVAGIKTRAEKKGNQWVLNGSKMCTNAGHANWFLLAKRKSTWVNAAPIHEWSPFKMWLCPRRTCWALQEKASRTMGQPIINHQGVAFMLADMAIGAEAARGLVWRAAWAKDSGERNSFNTEMPMEKLYRDAKIYELYEGTSQIQRLIVSRQLSSLYPA